MKKIKLLMPIVGASITAIAPITTLASCSNSSIFEEARDQILNEFKKMCEIPHSSDKVLRDVLLPWEGNVWNMSCYLYDRFTEILGAGSVNQDLWGNLWFNIPANDDAYKNYPTVGLQAHMDMVFSFDSEKYKEQKDPDPLTTKIELVDEVVDGKRVLHSKDYKTTIGADDGIGVSTILALAQSKTLKHGPLRVILTNCEEKAMQGAQLLIEGDEVRLPDRHGHPEAVNDLKYLMNLDGEDEGDITVGCSGGVGSYYEQNFEYKPISEGLNKFDIAVFNFQGGHSGTNISEYIANPIKFINAILLKLCELDDSLELIDFETPGVLVYNKIPDKCYATIATKLDKDTIEKAYSETLKEFKEKKTAEGDHRGQKLAYSGEDWDRIDYLHIIIENENPDAVSSIKHNDTIKILQLQDALDFGVIVWPTDEEMAKFTGEQTSASVGPVMISDVWKEDETPYVTYTFASYSRSTEKEKVDAFYTSNVKDAEIIGDTIEHGKKHGQKTYSSDAKFPSWKNENQDMAELAKKAWKEAGVDEKKIAFSRTHGGVENSWWYEARRQVKKDIHQISIGAQLHDCHEPTETCEVDTIVPFVKTVIYILQHVNELEK